MQSEYAINNQKLPDRQYKGEKLYEKKKKKNRLERTEMRKKKQQQRIPLSILYNTALANISKIVSEKLNI